MMKTIKFDPHKKPTCLESFWSEFKDSINNFGENLKKTTMVAKAIFGKYPENLEDLIYVFNKIPNYHKKQKEVLKNNIKSNIKRRLKPITLDKPPTKDEIYLYSLINKIKKQENAFKQSLSKLLTEQTSTI